MSTPNLRRIDCGSSDGEVAALYRRTMATVVMSQIFGGAGLAAGVTVGALLAADMTGSDSLAGLPAALLTLGSAAAALLVGRSSSRFGRRRGLVFGYAAGSAGAFGVVLAAISDNTGLLFASLLVYGSGTATNLQARYAGTDLAAPDRKATAVSTAMVATTLGAVAGPNMVGVTGDFANTIDIPVLAGPFLLAGVAYFVAGTVLLVWLRPDPYLLAKQLNTATSQTAGASQRVDRRGVEVGAAVMISTQMVMVAIMTMTPIYMRDHGHSLGAAGMVIGAHIGAMYLPSLVTGALVDKFGRLPMAIVGALVLIAAGVTAALSPPSSLLAISIALGLLGIGWNIGIISGTALIADSAQEEQRARTQGTVDVLLALSGATGGALSGVIVGQSSYATLSLVGGAVGLAVVVFVACVSQARPMWPVEAE